MWLNVSVSSHKHSFNILVSMETKENILFFVHSSHLSNQSNWKKDTLGFFLLDHFLAKEPFLTEVKFLDQSGLAVKGEATLGILSGKY